MNNDSTDSKLKMLKVGTEEDGQRLDNYLIRNLKGVPKSLVYRLIRQGHVRVNKSRKKPEYRIKSGDMVKIPQVRSKDADTAGKARGFSRAELEAMTVYEDDVLLALNKPCGLAVHSGSGIEFGLIERLRASSDRYSNAELVHRLDRETSGCLLIATRKAALRELQEKLRDQGIIKRYLALVRGYWPYGKKTQETRLDTHDRSQGERTVTVSEHGRLAISHFAPVEFYQSATLMEVEISTGRTHQIRVQAAETGHPLAGDSKYGDKKFNQLMKQHGLNRMFLHSHYLEVPDFRGQESLSLSAPLTDELKNVLEQLQPAEKV